MLGLWSAAADILLVWPRWHALREHVHAGLDPLEVVEKVQELCLKLVVVKVGLNTGVLPCLLHREACGTSWYAMKAKPLGADVCRFMQGEDSLSTEARRNATFLFHSHLRATLAAKRVLSEYRLTQEAFAWLVGEIETRFQTVRTCQNLYNVRLYGTWL